jgi:hypothetical protein
MRISFKKTRTQIAYNWEKTLCIVLFLFAISIAGIKIAEKNGKQRSEAIDSFIFSLTTGLISSSLAVLVGTKTIKQYIQESNYSRKFSGLKLFWSSKKNDGKQDQESNEITKFMILLVMDCQESTKSDNQCEFDAVSREIFNVINNVYGTDNIEIDVTRIYQDFPENHIKHSNNTNYVIVGCGSTSTRMRDFCTQLNLHHLQRKDTNLLEISTPPSSMKTAYESELDRNSNEMLNYVSVNRICNHDQVIITFNSCHVQGLLNAVKYFTNHENFQSTGFLDALPQNYTANSFDKQDYTYAVIRTQFDPCNVRASLKSITSDEELQKSKVVATFIKPETYPGDDYITNLPIRSLLNINHQKTKVKAELTSSVP